MLTFSNPVLDSNQVFLKWAWDPQVKHKISLVKQVYVDQHQLN